MVEITQQYTKLRCAFGQQPLFCDVGPEMCDSIASAPAEFPRYMLRNPVHAAVQHGPPFSEHTINTFRAEVATTGINHAEGGWPKDVNVNDVEATQRYRRKVEKEEQYIHCVNSTFPDLEHYILQNNAVDMYNIYFMGIPPTAAHEHLWVRTVNVYRAPEPAQPVSSLGWQPDGGNHLAVAYNDVDCATRRVKVPFYSYIWDLEKANEPLQRFQPPCPLVDLQFNAREPSVLAGGLLSGQVGAWDRRVGPLAQMVTPPHVAHRDLVRNVLFINAKSGQELFSSGPDGVCKWWDLRAFQEPTEEMIIDVVKSSNDEPNRANANGVSALEFEPTIPTRFMVGTENGLVLGGNRKGKTALEKLPTSFSTHSGPVMSLERNPFFLKNFLTVGDWTARVWSEECRESAVLWSPPQRHKITSGCWSATRVSLMLLAQGNGVLGVWDLLRKQHEPILTMQVCEELPTRICPHEAGNLVAIGSQKGSIYMVELSEQLAQSDKQDKAQLASMLEREAKRERILEARLREIRLKMKQAEELGDEAAGGGSATELEAALGDRDLLEATQDYFQQVKKELASM